MALEDEIAKARKEIVSDGYEMSIGEIVNLYRDGEIIINPDFQRLFRWESSRKTRFMESILLGIPTPPIFVYQTPDGVWELVDGLQRLSTVFEFIGILRNPDSKDENGKAKTYEPSSLEGTRYLPSLAGKRWLPSLQEGDDGIGHLQQLQIKRARLRVEILRNTSSPDAKFELFQRLNTGGAELSEQEVRNCVAIMLNKDFYVWLKSCSEFDAFRKTISQTDVAIEKQAHIELALRFFAYRNVPYTSGRDVHEYLDGALREIATSKAFDREAEKSVFERTFQFIYESVGDQAFKRWNGSSFSGKFLLSVFEVVGLGLSKNLDVIEAMPQEARIEFIKKRFKDIWNNEVFKAYSGQGVRGTTRLSNLLPMAAKFLQP